MGPNVSENDVIYKSDSNTIIIKNNLSVDNNFGKQISDDNGGSYGYLEFSIENTQEAKRDYQIYIRKNDVYGDEINSKYLRFYLTDGEDNPLGIFKNNKLPSYVDLNFMNNLPNGKLLYSGSLDSKETLDFKLRVWIASNYVIIDKEEAFSFEIGARAI